VSRLRRRVRRWVRRILSRWRERSPRPTAAPARPDRGPTALPAGRSPTVLVVVLDGLRPDSINPNDTPHLDRLRREGVDFAASHAVFPTGTRVNAAAIATGTYPAANGFVGNSLYDRMLDPARPVHGGNHERLLALAQTGGRLLFTPTLGELLAARGLRFAALGSASPGSTLLLSPSAPLGTGLVVNGRFKPGVRVAYPDDANRAILARFGHPSTRGSRRDRRDALLGWTQRVLIEHVLAELRPDVVVHWITEPDTTQHAHGVGSPQAVHALRELDRGLGTVLDALERSGMAETTDVLVLSDHGVTRHATAVDVDRWLIDAGLKASPGSDDVLVVSNGPSALLYVKDREPARVRKLVEFLQGRDQVGVIFTAADEAVAGRTAAAPRAQDRASPPADGWVPGTFSLELIHEDNPERHPDVLLTFVWSSAPNEFGVPGTDVTTTKGTGGGTTRAPASGHGGMSPWAVRNTLLARGPRFKRGLVSRVPAGNVDVVPTILQLLGVGDVPGLDGRVLREALHDGPDQEQVPVQTRTYITTSTSGAYRAALQVSEVGRQRYVDKGWRLQATEPVRQRDT
jgi:arylsulfatase A-like enzyme